MVESHGDKPLVTITGVTGYLGSTIAYDFVKDGNYRVRGTVRNKKNDKKINPIKIGFGEYYEQIELVEADLDDAASLDKAVEGATYVVHTASPFYFETDEDKICKPVLAGIDAIIKACTRHEVKRCVLTSSCAAITCVPEEKMPKPGDLWNETYWSDEEREEGMDCYMKSKTLAEKAAWKYLEERKENNESVFELVAINPVFIMGPSIACGDGFSESWLKIWLDGSKKAVPRINMSFVDIRDVSMAHLKAVKVQEAANERFLISCSDAWLRDVILPLGPQFPDLKIPKD